MQTKGAEFHKLVEHLERALTDLPDVSIESPKYMRDKVTGALREHDIVLTHRQPHREFVIAIECRDRSRRVTVEQIEAFRTKCGNTGIDKGIIVSSSGFYGTATEKASFYGIDCMTVEEFQEFRWIKVKTIEHTLRTLGDCHADIVVGPEVDTIPDPFKLYFTDKDGIREEVNLESLSGLPLALFNQVPMENTPGESGFVHVEVTNLDDLSFEDSEERHHNPQKLVFHMSYENERVHKPVRYFAYGNGDRQYSEVAISDFGLGPVAQGKLMFIQTDEGFKVKVISVDEPQLTSGTGSD